MAGAKTEGVAAFHLEATRATATTTARWRWRRLKQHVRNDVMSEIEQSIQRVRASADVSEDQVPAVRKLYALSKDAACHAEMASAGAIEVLVSILTNTNAPATEFAARALANLVVDSNERQLQCAGAIEPLVVMLNGGVDVPGHAGRQGAAARAISALASSPENAEAIVRAGATEPLQALMKINNPARAASAAAALEKMGLLVTERDMGME